jgi:hypothetical protein
MFRTLVLTIALAATGAIAASAQQRPAQVLSSKPDDVSDIAWKYYTELRDAHDPSVAASDTQQVCFVDYPTDEFFVIRFSAIRSVGSLRSTYFTDGVENGSNTLDTAGLLTKTYGTWHGHAQGILTETIAWDGTSFSLSGSYPNEKNKPIIVSSIEQGSTGRWREHIDVHLAAPPDFKGPTDTDNTGHCYTASPLVVQTFTPPSPAPSTPTTSSLPPATNYNQCMDNVNESHLSQDDKIAAGDACLRQFPSQRD